MLAFLLAFGSLFLVTILLYIVYNTFDCSIRESQYIYYNPDLGPEQEYCQYVQTSIDLGFILLDDKDISYSKNKNIIKINYAEFDLDKNTHILFDCIDTYDRMYHYVRIN